MCFLPPSQNLIDKELAEVVVSRRWDSLVAQTAKRPPAMQETWVRSPGLKDPLEKEMVTHSSTLA